MIMAVDLVADLWSEIRRYITTVDRSEVADVVVNFLIDNDYDASDIRTAFKGDADIKRALESYLDDQDLDEEEDDPYDDTWDE
jgi:hypothetical protein